MERRNFLAFGALILASASVRASGIIKTSRAYPTIEIYRDPTCECCERWIKYIRYNGFIVHAHDEPTWMVRAKRSGVPDALIGCHTATMNGYILEGLVPAREIKRLLAERPNAAGLAVPSMPPGAPGMEGDRKIPYDVMLFTKDGHHSVYAHYKT